MAVAPSATAEVVAGLVAGNSAATVVDTAGVKEQVLGAVRQTLGETPHFVGTHPMAGRERSGPGAARADLFEGRPWVLVPDGADERSAGPGARALVELCGGVPLEMVRRSTTPPSRWSRTCRRSRPRWWPPGSPRARTAPCR